MANGRHTMRWQCPRDGCWKEKNLLKFDVFAGCFPRDINFTDLDGIVELNGNFLVLEWKNSPCKLPTGQRIMLERMTASGVYSALIVAGDAERMIPSHVQGWWKGRSEAWKPCDIHLLRDRICNWVEQVTHQRVA